MISIGKVASWNVTLRNLFYESLYQDISYGYLRICSYNTGIFFHGDIHGVWRKSEAEIVDHCLCRVECPMNVVKEDE